MLVVGAGDERSRHGDRRPVRRGEHHCGQPHPQARRTAGRQREPGYHQVTGLADLPAAIAAADVVISCTGAAGQVITGEMVSAALAARAAQRQPRRPGGQAARAPW